MRRVLALLLLGVVAFLVMLGRRDIVISHEARVAQTARQMAASGWPWAADRVEVPVVTRGMTPEGPRLIPSGEGTVGVNPWLVPVLNGSIRLQKPPLPYWCAAVSFKLFGVSEWAARLVPGVMGVLGALVVYGLGRRLFGERVGWFAGLAWVSSHFVVDEFRKAMADPYLTFAVLVAAWAWVRGGARQKSEGGSQKATAWVLLFYAAAVWGFLAKGPPVYLPWVGIVLGSYHVLARGRVPRSVVGHVVGVILLVVLGGAWYVYIIENVPHAMDIWRYESVGELAGENKENVREWWFYAPNFFLITLPWLAAMGMGVWAARRRAGWDRRRLFAAAWLLVPVVFFSFVGQKKNAYLLPAMPGAAVLAGQGVVALLAVARRDRGKLWPGVVAGVLAWICIGFAVATVVLVIGVGGSIGEVAFAVVAAVVAAAAFGSLLKGIERWPVVQAVAFLLVIVAFVNFYVTAKENARSAREIAGKTRELAESTGGAVAWRHLPEEASFYLPLGYAGPGTSNLMYAIVDDRRDEVRPDVRAMGGMGFGRRVVAARQVPVDVTGAARRWKLFELTVE